MNRQQAKELLPIIQAFAEGKTIQVREDIDWCYLGNETDFDLSPQRYRIKPEPKYHSFLNAEECWQEMKKHEPFGWVKDKQDGHYALVCSTEPYRDWVGFMWCIENIFDSCAIGLPKGSIKKLIGRELTWEDEPVELK